MQKLAIWTVAACGALCAPLWGDFSYEQTSRMTGGSMLKMMRMIPGGGKATQPTVTQHLIQGDRMASITQDSISVIDLSKETMTHIDLKQKSYSVITFQQFRDGMAAMQRKLAAQMRDPNANVQMDFKAEVKDTGQTRMIQNLNTKEMILLLTSTMQGQGAQAGQTATMSFTSDMWLAKNIPGYQEMMAFNRRYAEKLGAGGMASSFGPMMRPGMSEGMAKLAKEAAKLDGVPVLQVISMMGAGGPGMPDMSEARQQGGSNESPDVSGAAEREAQRRAQNEAAYQASRPAGRLGGLTGAAAGSVIGGLGGFGRKKKQQQEEQPAPAPEPQAQPRQAPPAAAGQGNALMEITVESGAFSTAPVDGSKFSVPAGFKQVEHEMVKALRENK